MSAPNRVYSCMSIYSSLYHFPDEQLYTCLCPTLYTAPLSERAKSPNEVYPPLPRPSLSPPPHLESGGRAFGEVTWSDGALHTGRGRDARVKGCRGPAAEVHHGGGSGGGGRQPRRVRALVVLRAGGNAVFGQKLLQVHVLQLESVSVIGKGFVP